MRVIHVVAAFAPDGRFGGPSSVALDLCQGLRRRGHQVILAGAAVGYGTVPEHVSGLRTLMARGVNPLPFLGWAPLSAPALGPKLAGVLRGADLVHVHLGRDLVTLPCALMALRAGVPYVIQTHGMVDASERTLARAIDTLATRRVVAGARSALTLTAAEDGEITRLSPGTRVERLPNGIHVGASAPPSARSDVVLFLARLHPRKGAPLFARTALAVGKSHPEVSFEVVGPDEGDAREVAALAARSTQLSLVGAVPNDDARRRLASCLVYVLPAEREPFGMTVIEALAGGRPVVLAASAELAPAVVDAGAGWSFGPGGTHDSLEGALRHVLDHPDDRERAARAARALAVERFSIEGVLDRLERIYGDAVREERDPS